MKCPFCEDTGQIVYDAEEPVDEVWRAKVKGMPVPERLKKGLHQVVYSEAMAPCDNCEKGKAIEFPSSGKPGPWGKDGFWRGRSSSGYRLVMPSTQERKIPGDAR